MQQNAAPSPESENRSKTGVFGRVKKFLLSADEGVSLFKNLSIVGLIGAVVGSYFQYVSWREEQNLQRYKEDFAAATAVFTEVASTLSTAMHRQQIVYFNYQEIVVAMIGLTYLFILHALL